MWIETLKMGKRTLINSLTITSIEVEYGDSDDYTLTVRQLTGGIRYHFDWVSEAEAFYDGFCLALNGLDFVMGEENEEPCYIKPLLQSKNENLYKYMMLKEVIGERK